MPDDNSQVAVYTANAEAEQQLVHGVADKATRTHDVITSAPLAALKVHSSKRAEDREAAHAVAAR
jgi:hypothetical protein